MKNSYENKISTKGFCKNCGKEHFLPEGNARKHCLDLMKVFDEQGRIDLSVADKDSDSRLSIDYLFGKARGQMFGVLETSNLSADKAGVKGETIILKAFSGQYNGIWYVEGWVPPLLEPSDFDELIRDEDKRIKYIGKEINQLPCNSEKRPLLINERRQRSQNLQQAIFSLYKVHNFRGEVNTLFDAYNGSNGIPTGTGDCCAPKLLNFAAKNNLKPIGLAEFYWGETNLSGTRQHGEFYSSCKDKCYPILGNILCGCDE